MTRICFVAVLFALFALCQFPTHSFAEPAPPPCVTLYHNTIYPAAQATNVPVDTVVFLSWGISANCKDASAFPISLIDESGTAIKGTFQAWSNGNSSTAYGMFRPDIALTPQTKYTVKQTLPSGAVETISGFTTGSNLASDTQAQPTVNILSSTYQPGAKETDPPTCLLVYEIDLASLPKEAFLHIYAAGPGTTQTPLPGASHTTETTQKQHVFFFSPGSKSCRETQLCIAYQVESMKGTKSQTKQSCQTPEIKPVPSGCGCQQTTPTTPISWLALFLLVGLLRHHRTRLNNTK